MSPTANYSRHRLIFSGIILLGLLAVTVAAGLAARSLVAASRTPALPSGYVAVSNVIDGDTIDVKLNGKKERVRLIGINTPETVDKRRPIQCFGPEASKRTHELLDHHAVRLEAGAEDRDKYGRLLRFVFSEDATNVGQRLISEGYAQEYTYQGQSYRYQSEFKRAETEAKSAGRGLWSAGACNGDLNHAVS